MLAIAALLLPAVSCKKTPANQVPANIPTPENEIHQTKLDFAKASSDVLTKDGEKVETIELTGGKKYLGTLSKDGKKTVKIGKYTVKAAKASAGYTYELEGLGTITIKVQSGGNYDVTADLGGGAVDVTVTEATRVNTSGNFAAAFQDWTVKSVTVNVTGDGIPAGISKTFTGCDLLEIANYVKSMNVSLNESVLEKLQGYSVTGVSLSAFGTFAIDFAGKPAFVGSYSGFNPAAGSFQYKFESFDENLLISGAADGVLTWVNGDLVLSITGNVTYNESKTYKAILGFVLAPAK